MVMIVLPTLVKFDRDAIVFFGHPATRHLLVKDTNKKQSEHIDFGYPPVKMNKDDIAIDHHVCMGKSWN